MINLEMLPCNIETESVRSFFNAIFGDHLKEAGDFIELRVFKDGASPRQYFHPDIESACSSNHDGDVYFGVAPRSKESGGKDAISHVTCLWADLDFGKVGHKKNYIYKNESEALEAIKQLQHPPSIIVHSGGGFHLYWLLKEAEPVSENDDRSRIEAINRGLARALRADSCHNVDRIFRVPGTFNFKDKENPRHVRIIEFHPDRRYTLDDFDFYRELGEPENVPKVVLSDAPSKALLSEFKLSRETRKLIMEGGPGKFESRSEADLAAINALVAAGATDDQIKSIFLQFAIGEKFREKGRSGDAYLALTISKARAAVANREEKKKFDAAIYVQKIKEADTFVFLHGLGFYRWDGSRGVFRHATDSHVKSLLHAVLGDKSTNYARREIYEQLQLDGDVLLPPEVEMNDRRDLLNLKNGMFDLNSFELMPHDPEYRSSVQLNVSYDPDAGCPLWEKFLREVLPNSDDRQAVQEMTGYFLTPDTSLEKAFLLFGPGANGKSVLVETAVELVGIENVSRIQPYELDKDFHRVPLIGKLLNVSSDLNPRDIVDTGTLKALISGDSTTDSYKHRDLVTFSPFARFLFATNELPRVNDKSYGFSRRIQIIEFPRVFEPHERDLNLRKKLLTELNGIFNWALVGLRRLREQGEFTVSATSEKALADYQRFNNPIITFAEEELDFDADAEVESGLLYSTYENWAKDNGFRPQSRETFFRDLRREFPLIQRVRRRVDGARAYLATGVKLT